MTVTQIPVLKLEKIVPKNGSNTVRFEEKEKILNQQPNYPNIPQGYQSQKQPSDNPIQGQQHQSFGSQPQNQPQGKQLSHLPQINH